jgi:hypothetical protein
MRITNALPFSLLLLFSTGCANFASLDWSREIGWIIPGPEVGAVLEFPDTVRRSVPTAGIVTTRGSSSYTRPASTEVTGDGLEVRITPSVRRYFVRRLERGDAQQYNESTPHSGFPHREYR